MSLNSTPSSERIQIGFFGETNSGKSSLINAVTNQHISIVSDVKGTTTDPVSKAMELLPLGPVSITDTAGYNDLTELGKLRTEKTLKVLQKTDIAILVTDSLKGLTENDKAIINFFKEKNIKFIIAYNKCDLITQKKDIKENEIYVSALNNININELKEMISILGTNLPERKCLIGDLIEENDKIILVTPIDESAPKGRLILPQQRVIRDILDNNAIAITTKETELEETLKLCPNPKLIITDSQVFGKVNKILPEDIKLTSFSIIFARYKGILKQSINAIKQINNLQERDYILISEGCTHHRQCNDIGTVKLPKWLQEHAGKNFNFDFTSGMDFPSDLQKYKMIIHCGGCMLNEKEVLNRFCLAEKQNIPMTNYGVTIAYMNGILERSIEIFTDLQV